MSREDREVSALVRQAFARDGIDVLTGHNALRCERELMDGLEHKFTVPGKDRILGVTIVGEHAGELLAEFVPTMKHGQGLNKILGTIHTYPTLAEVNKYVAGEWKRAHAQQKTLAWLARYHTWRRS